MRKALLRRDLNPKRDRHGFRGVPPPASFSLQDLPDDAQLTEAEVAAIGRWSTNTVASWRRRPDHPLEWEYVAGGFVRYRAGKLKTFMAMPPRRGGRGRVGAPAIRQPSTQPLPKEVADQQKIIRELSAQLRKAKKAQQPNSLPPKNV
jgi:hypothetical protein